MYGIRLSKIFLLSFSIFLFLVPYSYGGSIPQLINYQGTLTDTSGNPVPDGQYGVVFSIYDVATEGTSLWTETWDSSTTPISTNKGNFSVLLGTHNPIPASFFADHPLTFLGIKVGADSEMSPRQKIASVGYAFKAEYGVPKGAIIIWSGAIDQIPEGWALCDGNNGTPDLRDRFIVGAGSGYSVGTTGGEAMHTLTINEMPSHTHVQNPHTHIQNPHVHPTTIYNGNEVNSVFGIGEVDESHYTENTGSATATNQNTTAVNQNTGGGVAHENRPPYYALAFIMKL